MIAMTVYAMSISLEVNLSNVHYALTQSMVYTWSNIYSHSIKTTSVVHIAVKLRRSENFIYSYLSHSGTRG